MFPASSNTALIYFADWSRASIKPLLRVALLALLRLDFISRLSCDFYFRAILTSTRVEHSSLDCFWPSKSWATYYFWILIYFNIRQGTTRVRKELSDLASETWKRKNKQNDKCMFRLYPVLYPQILILGKLRYAALETGRTKMENGGLERFLLLSRYFYGLRLFCMVAVLKLVFAACARVRSNLLVAFGCLCRFLLKHASEHEIHISNNLDRKIIFKINLIVLWFLFTRQTTSNRRQARKKRLHHTNGETKNIFANFLTDMFSLRSRDKQNAPALYPSLLLLFFSWYARIIHLESFFNMAVAMIVSG